MSAQDSSAQDSSADDTATDRKNLLADFLAASAKIALSLAWSVERLDRLMPLSPQTVGNLSDEDEESLDAFLHRFTSLVTILQDNLGRSILAVEEEDLSDKSRKDQRLLLEKLGALEPKLGFGDMAELRNKISHRYPDDPAKQTEILNDVFARAWDAIEGFNGMRAFADERHFGGRLEISPIAMRPRDDILPKRS